MIKIKFDKKKTKTQMGFVHICESFFLMRNLATPEGLHLKKLAQAECHQLCESLNSWCKNVFYHNMVNVIY